MIILNYSYGCTWVPKNRESLPAVVRDRRGGRRSERFDIVDFEDGGRAQAEEFWRPVKARKSQEMCSPLEASERNKP